MYTKKLTFTWPLPLPIAGAFVNTTKSKLWLDKIDEMTAAGKTDGKVTETADDTANYKVRYFLDEDCANEWVTFFTTNFTFNGTYTITDV